MDVGRIVKFNSNNEEMTDLTGKYILKASAITFERPKDWEATATIFLIRTNKTI